MGYAQPQGIGYVQPGYVAWNPNAPPQQFSVHLNPLKTVTPHESYTRYLFREIRTQCSPGLGCYVFRFCAVLGVKGYVAWNPNAPPQQFSVHAPPPTEEDRSPQHLRVYISVKWT